MINSFLSKTVPVIGKYFRPIALLCIGTFLFIGAWFITTALINDLDFQSFGSAIGSIFDLLTLVFFVVFLGLLGIYSFWNIKTRGDNIEYEPWGVAFYFLILATLIYAVYKLLKLDIILIALKNLNISPLDILGIVILLGLLVKVICGLLGFLFVGARNLLKRFK